ncbi:DNA-3-methyladenine glycosylase 2 family protein [Mucilaginibacter roseus]|uniref:DNA-3-methyladenine glycosylase II n=1 Tax=Mucilaginibacter roseus TaxID=1528868 RepID=A0ABS8U9B3_9SPHI|nr:DNA-3-methyladenine glycosylase 2 family protein [Mucilaginibacter roseus]MCD8742456.1 DNA-3-methyladenine glycosylase 2 family protein [Mucilaginibacter roseus]
MNTFDRSNFHALCDELAGKDADLKMVIDTYGYPPMWSRPNTFETLVHIILEQQVSLASALSALNKLRERIQEITPSRLLLLTDEELKACYFSRQKTIYVRYLAEAMLTGEINLKHIATMPDDAVRNCLTTLKGIGNWTVDVYLMFVLHRADVFPSGDLAAVNALKRIKQLPPETTKEAVALIAEQWKPYRTVATMMLWHWYLSCPKKARG